jgi:biopolymer transport protein ExbD
MDNKDNVAVTIVAEVGTPFDDVVEVMNMAARLRIKAILATEPKS